MLMQLWYWKKFIRMIYYKILFTCSINQFKLTSLKVMFVSTFCIFFPGNPPPMSRRCMLNPIAKPMSNTSRDCSMASANAPVSRQPLPTWKLVFKDSYEISVGKLRLSQNYTHCYSDFIRSWFNILNLVIDCYFPS